MMMAVAVVVVVGVEQLATSYTVAAGGMVVVLSSMARKTGVMVYSSLTLCWFRYYFRFDKMIVK